MDDVSIAGLSVLDEKSVDRSHDVSSVCSVSVQLRDLVPSHSFKLLVWLLRFNGKLVECDSHPLVSCTVVVDFLPGCEGERQYRTLISLLGLLATMRRVVNYHSSWARQQQGELFDTSGNPGFTAGRGFNPAGGAPGGELERVHLNCFPGYGSIKIDAMMVKRRSCYYYLPESLPLKYAFRHLNVDWFLRILVHMPSIDNQPDSFKYNGIEVISHNSIGDGVTDLVENGHSLNDGDKNIVTPKRKKRKVLISPYCKTPLVKMPAVFHLWRRKKTRKRNRRSTSKSPRLGYKLLPLSVNRRKRWDSSVVVESLTEALPETVSVSGIIHKYFSDYDEVASSSRFSFTPVLGRQKERLNNRSKYSTVQPRLMSPLVDHKPRQVEKPDSNASREKHWKPEVGKRVVLASNSLGLTPSYERPALSACKFSDKRSDDRFASLVRTPVFEIPDEGD
ncbi:hypothetical protein F511_38117 [Dorcoceras hygrometricum]|uniref:Uncharacterized protein n=1 Tax=Dorcoceras hygrometricum TaxID=472368 RepID=A0A2Z7D4L0_9LAMI|nr:hypothetical protein F511_38117 [Dorcoceras hygrometricum]